MIVYNVNKWTKLRHYISGKNIIFHRLIFRAHGIKNINETVIDNMKLKYVKYISIEFFSYDR